MREKEICSQDDSDSIYDWDRVSSKMECINYGFSCRKVSVARIENQHRQIVKEKDMNIYGGCNYLLHAQGTNTVSHSKKWILYVFLDSTETEDEQIKQEKKGEIIEYE